MMYKAIDHVQNMKPEEFAHKVLFGALSDFSFHFKMAACDCQTETVLKCMFQYDELCLVQIHIQKTEIHIGLKLPENHSSGTNHKL